MVEYPKRTQLGCPLSLYYVYILVTFIWSCYRDAHVQTRTQYYNCMCENYYSHDRSESIWSRVLGSSWVEINKENKKFNFNVFLTRSTSGWGCDMYTSIWLSVVSLSSREPWSAQTAAGIWSAPKAHVTLPHPHHGAHHTRFVHVKAWCGIIIARWDVLLFSCVPLLWLFLCAPGGVSHCWDVPFFSWVPTATKVALAQVLEKSMSFCPPIPVIQTPS